MKTIELTRNMVALIDEQDEAAVSGLKWQAVPAGSSYYAVHNLGPNHKPRCLFMHRLIMQPGPGLYVDHINGDTLDNRRANLRVCTHSQNLRNAAKRRAITSSRFKGVSRSSKTTWRVYILTDAGRKYLGSFKSEIQAAAAYDTAAREHFGEYAKTNFARP